MTHNGREDQARFTDQFLWRCVISLPVSLWIAFA